MYLLPLSPSTLFCILRPSPLSAFLALNSCSCSYVVTSTYRKRISEDSLASLVHPLILSYYSRPVWQQTRGTVHTIQYSNSSPKMNIPLGAGVQEGISSREEAEPTILPKVYSLDVRRDLILALLLMIGAAFVQ